MECLIPDCKRKTYARGLCANCYQSAIRMIRNERTTWEQLIKEGFAKKAGTRGCGPNKFSRAFNALTTTDLLCQLRPQSLDDSMSNEELLRGFPPEVQAKFAEPANFAGSFSQWNPEKHGVV